MTQELNDVPIAPGLRSEKETFNESSDSSCEQQQLADGRQPCSCSDDTAKFDGRRVKHGRRGGRERNPGVRKYGTSGDKQ